MHNAEGGVDEVRRWNGKEKKYVYVPVPNIINVYNKSMGGVDKADMLLGLYRNKLKSTKSYCRFFHHCHDMAVNNSWIVSKYSNNEHISTFKELYRFKLEVALSMIRDGNVDIPPEVPNHLVLEEEETEDDEQPSGSTDPQAAQHVPDDCRLDGFWHFPKHVAVKPKRCRYTKCSRKSKYWCTKCRVYLCTDAKGILSYSF